MHPDYLSLFPWKHASQMDDSSHAPLYSLVFFLLINIISHAFAKQICSCFPSKASVQMFPYLSGSIDLDEC